MIGKLRSIFRPGGRIRTFQISLFDDISHYETASDTPLGALEKLQSQMLATVELK